MALRRPGREATPPPDRLLPEQRARVRAWVQEHHPGLEPQLGKLWSACRDYHLLKGTLGFDWAAGLRTWIRNEVKFEQRREPPEIRGRRRGAAEPDTLANVIELFKKEKS